MVSQGALSSGASVLEASQGKDITDFDRPATIDSGLSPDQQDDSKNACGPKSSDRNGSNASTGEAAPKTIIAFTPNDPGHPHNWSNVRKEDIDLNHNF